MQTKNVVYVLGAGFSAPLGIPVMSRFMEKARDLYESEPERFGHFKTVFDRMGALRKAGEYVEFDRFNVEDVLSVVEMEHMTSGTALSNDVRKFITDTVTTTTPAISDGNRSESHPAAQWFSDKWWGYAAFVLGLAQVSFRRHDSSHTWSRTKDESAPRVAYEVISLNYDMVIESILKHAGVCLNDRSEFPRAVPLWKLHGSVHDDSIVPPTWNKRLDGPVAEAWRKAAECLATAHEIRFVGYSFPQTDVNLRFLLASALQHNDRLAKLDVLCLDPDGTVEARYRKLLPFRRLRFWNEKVEDYLMKCFRSRSMDRKDSDHIAHLRGAVERAHNVPMA